ncbi:MAG TPA: translocation/assembly module TamB, partial [Sphingomicrobium sp.]|nr:translocation/assembly module TamB [Sphingomicrobium sp.]
MADIVLDGEPAAKPKLLKIRPHWSRRLAGELATLLVALMILLSLGLVLLDTAPGHRWLVDRLQAIETSSGLKFRIGRIEGSIFGESRLRNVQVLDQHGVFLTSPEITLDWSPAAWLTNTLDIDRLEADRLRLERLPKLKKTGRRGPLLPGFDIRIGKLEIRRFELAPAVTGKPQVGRLSGSADIRSGRAMVRLDGALQGGDRLRVDLDAEPDGDRFDIDVRASSPAGGLLPALFGSKRPLQLIVEGDGTWTQWRGRAAMGLSGRPTARLALAADKGRYRLSGKLAPAPFLKGKLQRLTTPVIDVRGNGTFAE